MTGGQAARVTGVELTPVAIKDPPLLNAAGVHQPYALRTIVEVRTGDGMCGLGETYGDDAFLERLKAAATALPGLDPFALNDLRRRIARATGAGAGVTMHDLSGPTREGRALASVIAPFEIACMDLQGHVLGRPVCDLLGGRVRDSVPFSAYLFFRWDRHPDDPGYPPDDWGAALDAGSIVAQARRMVAERGFRSIKLKGGVLPPEREVEAVLALREAFGDHALRLDPNAAWTVSTGIAVGRRLEGVLEYLEDPTEGFAGMAEVARSVPMPLATNMCVVGFEDLPEAIERRAVGIVLSDHHFWGGLRRSQDLAAICRTFGLGLSMHSNSHLGISLAAMTHLAASTPDLAYACDTHTPWQVEDVVEPGVLRFVDGAVPVPAGPGLGVTLDRDALARLHEQWRRCGVRQRDDVTPMRRVDPAWTGARPRF
jgi:glucarate dehydratase